MKQTVASLRANLQTFAAQHKERLKHDARLRAVFLQMCVRLGVDPLVSKKAFWAEVLGLGDFYYALAVKLIDCCMVEREASKGGGLVEMGALLKRIRDRASDVAGDAGAEESVTEEDLERSIAKLRCLNSGFAVVRIGGRKFVRSMPRELATDENEVLELVRPQP